MARILIDYDSMTEKACSQCTEIKSVEAFRRRENRRGRPYSSACRKCLTKGDIERYERSKAKGERKGYHLKKYGLTLEEYDSLFLSQNGLCYICKKPETSRCVAWGQDLGTKRLSIDHCHKTGNIRKLLCKNCNSVLGFAMEDVSILESCISYLREHSV